MGFSETDLRKFSGLTSPKQLVKNDQFHGNFLGKFHLKSIDFALI